MKNKWITYVTFVVLLILAVMVPVAGAYETTADCEGCHGNFRASAYSSLAAAKAANPAWPGSMSLHNGHANSATATPPGMLNGNCEACHSGSSRSPVYTGFSGDTAPFNQSCSGCHDGPGLRAHHVNSGADNCFTSVCHTGDPAPDAENVLRPAYTAAFGMFNGTTRVNEPCNPAAAGFEGRLADVTTIGLDNDGNGLYDQNDPACSSASPTISVSPAMLSFGNQAVGSISAAKTVTISNTGTGLLNVTGLTSSNAEFTFSPSTISPIAPGSSAVLSVKFAPAAPAGAKSATISILSNGGSATVSVTGTGVSAGALSVSPLTLTYGNQTVGTTSATQTVTIYNTGSITLTVTSITNSNTTDFVLAAPGTPLAINAGASQTFTVAFKPATAGARSANVTITSTAGSATVSAEGTGQQPTTGTGDVALVKGNAQRTITARVGRKYEMKLVAFATTTAKEAEATVTLTAIYPAGLTVSMEDSSRTEDLHAGDRQPKKFEFESEITCMKKGTWPITWTATISSSENSNPANDVLTGKTQVTCSSSTRRD